MPYHLSVLPSFERSIKKMDASQRAVLKQLIRALAAYFASNGDLEKARMIAPHFFFKQLRRPFYEAGIESRLRVVLRKEELEFFALLAGNHDQVKKFLSGN